jgi:hypothetical protein
MGDSWRFNTMSKRSSLGVVSGAGVGMIFGAAFGNVGVGMVLGAGLGLVLGAIFNKGSGA